MNASDVGGKDVAMAGLVKGLGWLGVRTDGYEELITFFRDVLDLEIDHADEEMTAFELPDGSRVEVFGPRDRDHTHFDSGPVAGFVVDDVDAARTALEERGVGFIGETRREGGFAWAHFRGPDGNVYEITQG
jgi:predicted enzyme related to lactoylglutathione lyase